MRRSRGFTLVELLMVVTLLALVVAVAVPCLLRSQLAARQSHACSVMKALVTQESLWRLQDPDRNGVSDYWVRDVRGMYGVPDATGKPVALVDVAVARADRRPAFDYGTPLDVTVPDQGYFVQAMVSDQDGMPYVDESLPPPRFAPAAASCANSGRFGFTAFPASYERRGLSVYAVTEDGVIWEKDDGTGMRVLERMHVGPDAGWRISGG